MSAARDRIPVSVLQAYGLDLQVAEKASNGLINQTWIVTTTSRERVVVQRLHRAISSDVNDKIQAVTRHLESIDICSPRLVKTLSGANFVTFDDVNWRVLSYVPGTSWDAVPDAQYASEAGLVLARFHGAFVDPNAIGLLTRSKTHDLPRYLKILRDALSEHRQHEKFDEIEALARQVMSAASALPEVSVNAPRVVHGDPKISNILFDESGHGLCLVDLDTVGLMPLAWELGDAFRSWCNPHGEDVEETHFSLELFRAALEGYAPSAASWMEQRDIDAIVPAIQTIYTELAARFCADALRASYFAWDPERFSTRTEHNLVRARGQINAAIDVAQKSKEAVRIAASVFG